MNLKIFIIILSLLAFTSCKNEKNQVGYSINGIAIKTKDSTKIKLFSDNKLLDSTIVINEKFNFKGLVEKPTNMFLVVNNYEEYKSFWVENANIDFIAEKGKFKTAEINGSKTQDIENILLKRIQPIQIKMDSLEKIFGDRTPENRISKRDEREKAFNKYLTLRDKTIKTIEQDFVKEYPNSYVSTHILNVYKTTWKKRKVLELFSKMSKEYKETENGKLISRFIEINKDLKIGDKYVDFEQTNSKGNKIKFSNIKGKYKLIEFWASWCGSCRANNPNLVKLYKKFNDKGFEILGVSIDKKKEDWLKAIEKDNLHWENVADFNGKENEAALIYGISGVPSSFLINKNGIIIAKNLHISELESKLNKLLLGK